MTEPTPKIETIDGRAHIRWDDSYPVMKIKSPGPVPDDLPGERVFLKTEEIPECTDTLVFSERSGGTRDFLQWWCAALDSASHPWVLAWGSAWDPVFFEWSKAADTDLKSAGNRALEQFAQGATPTERAKALKEWANELHDGKKKCTLIIRHLTSLGNPAAQQAAEALGVLRESGNLGGLHLVVADTFEDSFLDNKDLSGYWRFAWAYRLAPFDKDAVRTRAAWKGAKDQHPLLLPDDALDALMAQTGGQPLLVQDLLRRLRAAVSDGEGAEFDAETVDRAATHLRASPPGVVRLWRADLERILAEHEHLRAAMKIYATNRTLGPACFPPPAEERPLFIAGWLRMNHAGRWGIASQVHRDIARPLLSELNGEWS